MKKLKLEKLQITQLKNSHVIVGGGGGETATNQLEKQSTIYCNYKKKQ